MTVPRKVDWQAIRDLARTLYRPAKTLIALAAANDPFYLTDARLRDAQWCAELYRRFRFGRGTHLRRIHYRIVSQETPIILPTGGAYLNTEKCWDKICAAAKDACYAGLIDIEDFVDQRNEEPFICLAGAPRQPSIEAFHGYMTIEIPDEIPTSGFYLGAANYPSRGMFHIEIWCEKSTVNDVLLPFGQEYGLNVQTSLGEISLTRCRELVERVAANGGRPVRILYVSDFDPAGQSMPVGAARKIEWNLQQMIEEGGFSNVQLQPVVLSHDQCVEYRLPRTPIKETECRAAAFEERYGEGATELDALEALHPASCGKSS